MLGRWRPASMAHRFALAAAGLAAAAVLLISLASWWLINRSHLQSLRQLAAAEVRFRAEAVGSDLGALAERMHEMAGSTILATGLVDSAGRETYLAPFLAGIRQINGVPVQVMFTDFEGREIAGNGATRFSADQLAWLRRRLEAGRADATIVAGERGFELVALAPIRYARTASPEGALFYKIALADLHIGDSLALGWAGAARLPDGAVSAPVPVPEVFAALELRVQGGPGPGASFADLAPQYLSILLIAATLFGTVVLVGAELAKLMTSDLQRLRGFASRFVGSGLSHERAPTGGSQEVSSLATSINTMLDRLDEQHSALLQEQEKLSHLTVALRIADRRKDDFLAMLAHELRNPLAPILTGAELVRRVPGTDPRVLRSSEIIARQAMHMREILEDLLDVSRVTRGLITLDRVEQDLATVVRTAVEQVRPLIDARAHRLTLDLAERRLTVLGDEARLVQIVSNLLTNAAKYTPEGGHIALSVEPLADQARIVVEDDGDGIAPSLMPELFDLFSQGSRAADRKQGGLGLGLALVRHLVELHGGSVQAASEGEGRGARFTVVLPLHRAAADAPPTDAAAAPAPARSQARLLLVDDNADAAQSLATQLELDGHQVLVAYEATAALALLDGQRIDACLLDIGLPGIDGYQLAAALRGRPETRDATLIAITGYGQPEDRSRSAAAGFDHHLVKPVDAAALSAALASAPRRARAPAAAGEPPTAGAAGAP